MQIGSSKNKRKSASFSFRHLDVAIYPTIKTVLHYFVHVRSSHLTVKSQSRQISSLRDDTQKSIAKFDLNYLWNTPKVQLEGWSSEPQHDCQILLSNRFCRNFGAFKFKFCCNLRELYSWINKCTYQCIILRRTKLINKLNVFTKNKSIIAILTYSFCIMHWCQDCYCPITSIKSPCSYASVFF